MQLRSSSTPMKSPKLTKAEKRAARHRARIAVLGEQEANKKNKTTSIQHDPPPLDSSCRPDNPTSSSYWSSSPSLFSPMKMIHHHQDGDKTEKALRGGVDEENSSSRMQYDHQQEKQSSKKLKKKEKRELRERARRAVMEQGSPHHSSWPSPAGNKIGAGIKTTMVQQGNTKVKSDEHVLLSPTSRNWFPQKPLSLFSPILDPPKSPYQQQHRGTRKPRKKEHSACKKLKQDKKQRLRERARFAVEGMVEKPEEYDTEEPEDDSVDSKDCYEDDDDEMMAVQEERGGYNNTIHQKKSKKKKRNADTTTMSNNKDIKTPFWRHLVSFMSIGFYGVVFVAMITSYAGAGPLLFLMNVVMICTKIFFTTATWCSAFLHETIVFLDSLSSSQWEHARAVVAAANL